MKFSRTGQTPRITQVDPPPKPVSAVPDPEVRRAAAVSLGRVGAPGEAAIKALLSVIGQPSRDIAFMALNTLGAYLRQPSLPPEHRQRIRTGLERWGHARDLDRELRVSVKQLLAAP